MPLRILSQVSVGDNIFACSVTQIVGNGLTPETQVLPPNKNRRSVIVNAVCKAVPVDQTVYVGGDSLSGHPLHIPSVQPPLFAGVQYLDIFRYSDSPSVCQGAVYFAQPIIFGISEFILEVSCTCGVPPYHVLCGCDLGNTLYDHAVSSVAISNTALSQILTGNSVRVSVVLACNDLSGQIVSIAISSDPLSVFMVLITPFSVVLPYRDYGPLISGELYAISGTGSVTLSVTDIHAVAKG